MKLNKLHKGDCLELMPAIPDKSVDMILCDLPYGTTKCKWDTVIPFAPLWEQYERVIKDNGSMLLFGSQPFTSVLVTSNLKLYRYDWYWQKSRAANFTSGNRQPLKIIETISCFYKKQPIYNPQKMVNPKGPATQHLYKNPRKLSNAGKERIGDSWKPDTTQNFHGKDYEPDKLLPKSLQYFTSQNRNRVHPTQKPVALFEYLIKTYTNERDIVLDNCAGSGTTAIACLNLNRQYILIEQDKAYCKAAKKRIKEHKNERNTD